jgi:hypothetical protein
LIDLWWGAAPLGELYATTQHSLPQQPRMQLAERRSRTGISAAEHVLA